MANDTVNPAQSHVTQTAPFTPAEITDIRRYCGYSSYGAFGYVFGTVLPNLDYQLVNMSDQEQTVVRLALTACTALEAAILTAGANMGTDVAAVWKRNRTEMWDRKALYDYRRRELCGFCGVPTGPALGDGGGRVVRC